MIGDPNDPISNIAQAIAKQEGFGIAGAAPTRNHNPGDISDGASTYGYDKRVTSSKVTSFPDDATGWQWLYNKLANIASGQSAVYSSGMTWLQIGSHWAADPNWGYGVASNLGVDPNSTFADYVAGFTQQPAPPAPPDASPSGDSSNGFTPSGGDTVAMVVVGALALLAAWRFIGG